MSSNTKSKLVVAVTLVVGAVITAAVAGGLEHLTGRKWM